MHLKNTSRQGAMLLMVLLVIVILMIAAVFSVDVAQMHMVRAELQTASDAAARAGTETLTRTQNPDLAVAAALAIAERNEVAGDGLTLNRADIVLGSSAENSNGGFDFVANQQPFTAVQVTAARDEASPDGTAPLLFANIFGVTEFKPTQTAVASASVRDIALVLDRSGSMNSRVRGGTRLSALQQAVRDFIQEVEASSPNSRISLTTYSSTASRDIALTDDFNQILNRVNRLRASGLTNIRQGLLFGSNSLEQDANRRRFAEKTVIVMTDGNFNEGGTPIPSANTAAGREHVIHTITFSSGANQTIMRQVAQVGGGVHIHADDAGDLSEAFREIARTLSVFLTQ